jgi:cold shock CspA family protein
MILGLIKMIAPTKSYGFVVAEDGREFFFHKEQCDEPLAGLFPGWPVAFELAPNQRGGEMAVRVSPFPAAKAT